MGWQFSHDGHTYREDDVTIGQWERICKRAAVLASGKDDAAPKPWPLVNPAFNPHDANAIFSIIVADQTGETEQAAAKIVQGWTTREYMDKFVVDEKDDLPTMYEDGLPKAEDGTSTSGSSGAPSDSDGPPTSSGDSP